MAALSQQFAPLLIDIAAHAFARLAPLLHDSRAPVSSFPGAEIVAETTDPCLTLVPLGISTFTVVIRQALPGLIAR